MSITATFPDSFPAAAIDVQTRFWNRRDEVQHPTNSEVLLSPFMCNGIIATYFACLEVTDVSSVPEGMIGFTLPAADYAMARCTNKTIGEGHGRVFTWLEANDYEPQQQGAMCVEVYHFQEDADEEPVDILIPISKNTK